MRRYSPGGVFSPKNVVTISIIKRYRPCAAPGYATPSAQTPPPGPPIITPPSGAPARPWVYGETRARVVPALSPLRDRRHQPTESVPVRLPPRGNSVVVIIILCSNIIITSRGHRYVLIMRFPRTITCRLVLNYYRVMIIIHL